MLANSSLTFDEARQQVMATNIFTTHTPVPAGIDMFPPDMVSKFFKNYIPSLKLDEEGFLALGREDVNNRKQGMRSPWRSRRSATSRGRKRSTL